MWVMYVWGGYVCGVCRVTVCGCVVQCVWICCVSEGCMIVLVVVCVVLYVFCG